MLRCASQIHKILAGLLDAHVLCGVEGALGAAEASAAYHLKRIDALVDKKGMDHWRDVLGFEFGGMNDVRHAAQHSTALGNKGHTKGQARSERGGGEGTVSGAVSL